MTGPTHLERKGLAWFCKYNTVKIFQRLLPLVGLETAGFSSAAAAGVARQVGRCLRPQLQVSAPPPLPSGNHPKAARKTKTNAYPIFGKIGERYIF